MKAKTLIIPAMSCVSLLAGCTFQTAHNDMWVVKPTMTASARAENPQAWYDLGRYYQGQEHHSQAAWALEKAVAADGAFAEARNRLAVSYALLGRHEEAIRQIEAALQAAPKAAHVYSNLGYVHYLKGNYTEAASALERAISLDPANARALNNLGLVHAQLGEEAKARSAFAQAATAQPPTVAAPLAVPEESRGQVVQVAPNIYELRQRPASPTAFVVLADRPSAPRAGMEVSNGNGVNGMAKRVGSYLKDNGFAAARLTNQQSFDVAATRVEYRNGYEAEARQVAAAMPHGVEIALGTDLRRNIGVRVVLGKDMTGSLGYFEQKTEPSRLAQNRLRVY